MKTLYAAIEKKIKAAGYLSEVDGETIYDEICEEIEDKEEGSYIFMSKQDDDVYFEYKIDVYEDQFNLGYMIIHTPGQDYKVLFD